MTTTEVVRLALYSTFIKQHFITALLADLPEDSKPQKIADVSVLCDKVMKEVTDEWFEDQLPIFIGKKKAAKIQKEFNKLIA